MREENIAIADLLTNEGTQMRPRLDEATVEEYHRLLGEGHELPKLRVVSDGAYHWVVDGHHTLEAVKRLETFTHLVCLVEPGSHSDAVLAATAANAHHGLRRDGATLRKCVETILAHDKWRSWSDRKIAGHVQCSPTFVGTVRRERREAEIEAKKLSTVESRPTEPQPDIRMTSAGGAMNVTGIGKRKKAKEVTGPAPLEEIEKRTTKKSSVEALELILDDWAKYGDVDPVEQGARLRDVGIGDALAIEDLTDYINEVRKVVYDWPDVIEAADRLLAKLQVPSAEAVVDCKAWLKVKVAFDRLNGKLASDGYQGSRLWWERTRASVTEYAYSELALSYAYQAAQDGYTFEDFMSALESVRSGNDNDTSDTSESPLSEQEEVA